jgi:hypothetical protein
MKREKSETSQETNLKTGMELSGNRKPGEQEQNEWIHSKQEHWVPVISRVILPILRSHQWLTARPL